MAARPLKTSDASLQMPLEVNPSRKEYWLENFRQVKEFYDANGHLTLPRDDPNSFRLTQWLTYQRHRSKSLSKDQLKLLESINYKTVPIHRLERENVWKAKYEKLERIYQEQGNVKIKGDRSLSHWLTRQRKLNSSGMLNPSRREMLAKLGVFSASLKKGKTGESPKQRERWLAQYEKLKQYRVSKGDCNVPIQWKEDPSLATWVFNQRRDYKMTKEGLAKMPQYRVEKLDQIGFVWSIRKIRSATKSNT